MQEPRKNTKTTDCSSVKSVSFVAPKRHAYSKAFSRPNEELEPGSGRSEPRKVVLSAAPFLLGQSR